MRFQILQTYMENITYHPCFAYMVEQYLQHELLDMLRVVWPPYHRTRQVQLL